MRQTISAHAASNKGARRPATKIECWHEGRATHLIQQLNDREVLCASFAEGEARPWKEVRIDGCSSLQRLAVFRSLKNLVRILGAQKVFWEKWTLYVIALLQLRL